MICRKSDRTARKPAHLLALVVLAFSACADNDRPTPSSDAGEPVLTDDASLSFSCVDRADGEECSVDRHCVAEKCLVNLCGDGVKAGEEECDDGNQAIGDVCTPSCHLAPGACGDGVLDPGEECDDANTRNDDFCTDTCLRQLCRNGVLDLSEECDDGNTDPRDGCNNSCQKIVCGDGVSEEQEECDDGNKSENDACSNQCTAIRCGNERIDVGEQCDRRLKRSADGKPSGEPLAEGSDCAADCKSIVTDKCQPCIEKNCRDFSVEDGLVPVGDVAAGCFEPGYLDPYTMLSTDAAWSAKCSALVECARRNRCDLITAWTEEQPVYDINKGTMPGTLLGGCFCGEVTAGSGTFDFALSNCYAAPAGKCVQQFYAATSCTDALCVEGNSSAQDTAAYHASFLTQCQRERCRSECR